MIRIAARTLLLLASALMAGPATVQGGSADAMPERKATRLHEAGPVADVRFAWGAPGSPATLRLELPAGMPAAGVEAVGVPGGLELVGFVADGRRGTLELLLVPPPQGSAPAYADVRTSDTAARVDLGVVRVARASPAAGPLRFRRSLSAPAGGLHLAVALQNTGDVTVVLREVEFLPGAFEPGPLLATVARDPGPVLDRLEAGFTPASAREGPDADEFGASIGVRWLDPREPDLAVAPGESLMLAWVDDSLPTVGSGLSFEGSPVVSYSTRDPASDEWRLGLPVTIRSGPGR